MEVITGHASVYEGRLVLIVFFFPLYGEGIEKKGQERRKAEAERGKKRGGGGGRISAMLYF